MSREREIEAKVMLTKTNYDQMITDFPIKANFVQSNYYFDTKDWTLKNHTVA